LGWLSNIFNRSKNLEDVVDNLKNKLRKADERNLSLEECLVTKELDINKADKSIQKIIQIWKNINSSESLSKILTTIVNGLSNDLDFLYCMLFRIYSNKEGTKLKVSIASEVKYFNMEEILGNKLKTFSIPYDCKDNYIIQALKSKKIYQMDNFLDIFKGSDLILENNQLNRLSSIFMDREITVIPLMVQGNPFGCLLAVSLKKEVSSLDKNYLNLFAGQIELSVSMTKLLESVKAQAVTDVLTGLYNRRYFNEALDKEVNRSKRSKRPFTLITLDLDHLKQINDTHGHTAGDKAIASIGSALLKASRETDIPARFGGEEFAIIMPDTDTDGGIIVAERIRSMIASNKIEGIGNITASLGVATYLKHANTVEDLVKIVDEAMYLAKENGRNRIEIAKTQSSPGPKVEFF